MQPTCSSHNFLITYSNKLNFKSMTKFVESRIRWYIKRRKSHSFEPPNSRFRNSAQFCAVLRSCKDLRFSHISEVQIKNFSKRKLITTHWFSILEIFRIFQRQMIFLNGSAFHFVFPATPNYSGDVSTIPATLFIHLSKFLDIIINLTHISSK